MILTLELEKQLKETGHDLDEVSAHPEKHLTETIAKECTDLTNRIKELMND